MSKKKTTILLLLGITFLWGCSSKKDEKYYTSDSSPTPEQVISMINEGDKFTPGWPQYSQHVAQALIKKYGFPTESTPQMLTWRGIVPFKRITVYREEIPHNFPIEHKDVIEHVVDYRVPVSRASDLTRFDGSVTFNRTRGELASCSDLEAMNYLALNLAHEVLSGRRSVTQARTEYGRRAIDYINGQKSNYMDRLMFTGSSNGADPDQSIRIIWTNVQAQEAPPAPKRKPSSSKKQKEMEMTE